MTDIFIASDVKELKAQVAALLLRVAHLEQHAGTHYEEPVVVAEPIGEPEPIEIPVDATKFLWSQGHHIWGCTFEFTCPACKNGTNADIKVPYQHAQGALIKFNCLLCKALLSAPITKVMQ